VYSAHSAPRQTPPEPDNDRLLVRRDTRDADELAACLRDWNQIYEQLAPGRFEGRFVECRLQDIQVFRERTNQPLYEAGLVRPGWHVVGVPVHLGGDGHCGGRPIRADGIVSMRGGDELDCRAPAEFDIVAASIPQQLLHDHAREVEHCEFDHAKPHSTVIAADPALTQSLRTLLLSVLDVAAHAPAQLRQPAPRRSLQQRLLATVVRTLAHPPGAASDPPPSASARHALVGRAQAYMRAHVDEPLSIEDLCRALQVSRRTLQYSFQDVLQVNPVRYLRALRLNGVRRTLKLAQPQASVHDIAARWGFWHMSRFADDYRRMFGELPSQTARLSINAR
jgi:AraC family ethanolamine operon transcriptional activator